MIRLPFFDKGIHAAPIKDFWALDEHEIPDKPGAYIILSKRNWIFPYPRRRSSVIYIGQATNLRRRLQEHLKFAESAKKQRKHTLYYPLYEWVSAFGGRYTYITTKTSQKPKKLESNLLAMFAEHYRAWPLANGIGAWNSLLTPKQLARRAMQEYVK